MDLPFETHKSLIEPVSERRHLRKTFADKLQYFDMVEDEDRRTGMHLHLLEERREAPLDMKDLEWLNYFISS